MCRAIFSNLRMLPAALSRIAENNLSILDAYWAKDEDIMIDEEDFMNHYVRHETQILSQSEAQSVYNALNDNL